MGVNSRVASAMSVDEFLAFTGARPDEEKWELIDGEPILNASPSRLHQLIVSNVIHRLRSLRDELKASWEVIPGIGVRVLDRSAPVPDVLVRPRDVPAGSVCDDMIVAFEVLSPGTADRDLRWKRRAYAALPSLVHYVIIAQDVVEVVAYDRPRNFAERRLESRDAILDLPVIGVHAPLFQIYDGTGLADS